MSTDGRVHYLETEIFEADASKLVEMMYRSAVEAVVRARRALEEGNIEVRSSAITKASEILNELALSVDHDSGGDLSRHLVELYDYMQLRLQAANFEQADAPLAEVERLIETLLDAWEESQPSLRSVLRRPATTLAPSESRLSVDCVG
jgi:flagellar protein FliS